MATFNGAISQIRSTALSSATFRSSQAPCAKANLSPASHSDRLRWQPFSKAALDATRQRRHARPAQWRGAAPKAEQRPRGGTMQKGVQALHHNCPRDSQFLTRSRTPRLETLISRGKSLARSLRGPRNSPPRHLRSSRARFLPARRLALVCPGYGHLVAEWT